jgi:hypothetical protein
MENRLLNKYGAHGSTDIGQEVGAVMDRLERELQGIIQAHNLSITEQHTLQHIVTSTVQCIVAENTLRFWSAHTASGKKSKYPLMQPPP